MKSCNFNPHIHLLAKGGGEDGEGTFHRPAFFQDSLLAEFFSREVFALLLAKEFISPEAVEKIASRRHTSFSVHSKVKALTRVEAGRVGKYMIHPLLSLERLPFSEKEGKASYRYRKEDEDKEQRVSYRLLKGLSLKLATEFA